MNNNVLNSNEAPVGYYAVLKYSSEKIGNICKECDWRKECQNPKTDFENSNHRCMSDGVISKKTGQIIKRKDGCSVMFIKKEIKNEIR